MAAIRETWKRMARNAKRAGLPLDRVAPDKEPARTIFIDEYNRFQPRKAKTGVAS